MTAPFTMEEAHRVCAEVVGELSLAITRRKGDRPTMQRWMERLRWVADAFEAKVKLAKGAPQEPDPKCPMCNGSGAWETGPEELGWRQVGRFEWVTDAGHRVPATMLTVWARCPCTERRLEPYQGHDKAKAED